MSKYFLFFLFLISSKSYSQKNNFRIFDSLQHYSYRLLGFSVSGNRLYPFGGTCFFIRKNKKIFLVTAKHVVTGCVDSGKADNLPSKLSVYIYDSSGSEPKSLPIEISSFTK